MNFYNYLNEAKQKIQFINVPEGLKNSMINYTYQSYFEYIEKKLDNLDDRYESLMNVLKNTYKIEEDRFDIKLNSQPVTFIIDKNDIPQEYVEYWEEATDKIEYVIDWEQKKWPNRPLVGGVYLKSKNQIMINPRMLIDCVKNKSYDINDYLDAFDKPKFTIWHELTHMIQIKAIKHIDPTEVAKNTTGLESQEERMTPEYRTKYLQNQLEFDPSVKTAIYKFLYLFRRKIKTKQDFEKYFDLFTLKGDYGKSNDFFRVLFKHQPDKWEKAVELLYDYLTFYNYPKFKK